MHAPGKLAATLVALAWSSLVVLLPLALLVVHAWPFELLAVERVALLRAGARSLALASVVATLSVGVSLLLARTVGVLPLLASLLVGRAIVAYGVLALGLAPGPLAAVLALLVDITPFVALLVWLRLHTRPRALLEAAADLGASTWVRVRDIAWPHLRPAIAVAWLWAALQVLGDVIAFELAGGGHSYTLGLVIRDALIQEHAPTRALVAVLALVMPALPCAWAITRELQGAARSDDPVRVPRSGGGIEMDWRALESAPRWLQVLGWLTMAALLLGPAALLLGEHPAGWSASDQALARSALRSLWLAGVVAVLASVLGFALALLGRQLDGPRQGLLGVALLAPLAIPASVLGLLLLGVGRWIGLPPGPALTIVALLGPALALGFVAARLLLTVIPTALLECAVDLGASARERLRLVWLPLGRVAPLVAFVIVFAWVLGQAAIPAFTSGPGGDTLAVGLTIHARAGAIALVRRWSAVMVATAVVAALLAALLVRRRPR